MMPVFTFETTHHALWAEELAREREIPVEVVPAPPAANARCNLAIETYQIQQLREVLEANGVIFRIWEG